MVMDREAYINEAMGQLNDSEVYMLLDGDRTKNIVKKINEKIRESWEKGNIDEKTKDYLMVSEDVKPGRFYLFPKIHKQGSVQTSYLRMRYPHREDLCICRSKGATFSTGD